MPHPMPASIRPMYMSDTDVDSPMKIQEAIFGIVVTSRVPLRPILSINAKGTSEPMPTPTYMRLTIQAISLLVTSSGSSPLNFGMVGVLHPSWRPQSMIKMLPGGSVAARLDFPMRVHRLDISRSKRVRILTHEANQRLPQYAAVHCARFR